jgi:hypothetical protein
MAIRFSGFFCPIFPASRAIPNFALRFTIVPDSKEWNKILSFFSPPYTMS